MLLKREILFRAKRADNGEWVYGHLAEEDCINADIIDDSVGFNTIDHYKVIPETVGQFTGLMDKNGNKIFEGDILTNNSQDDIIAGFYNGCFINNNTYITLHTEIKDPISRKIVFEITRNIHDNPTT